MIKYKVSNNQIDNMPDDVKPFVKPEMTGFDMGLLGRYLIRNKFRKFKERFKKVFSRNEKH